MAKQKERSRVRAPKEDDQTAALRKALARQSKADLVALVLEFAKDDRRVFRDLAARFDVAAPPGELVQATRQAIADATDYDDRRMNTNFDYDYSAYEEVKRNLGRLIAAGHLPTAMQLAVELMKDGSQQVEMSDEGLMTEDIEQAAHRPARPRQGR
jgi:hypothetical protein